MLDYLIMNGISKKTIDQLEKRKVELHSLELNKDECIKIIIYLRFLGVMCIDDLLLYRPELFICTKREVMSMFEKKGIRMMVEEINEDYENIDKLFD